MPILAGRLAGAKHARAWRLVGVLAFALAAGGCTTDGQPMASFASARNATIAFESIDGPPQPVFQKLVENLATEAVARQVAVISREATPQYRVRGYMAAHIEGRRIHIGWVWDVYDANKRRVLRIANEELGGRTGGDAWAAADRARRRRPARHVSRWGRRRQAADSTAGRRGCGYGCGRRRWANGGRFHAGASGATQRPGACARGGTGARR